MIRIINTIVGVTCAVIENDFLETERLATHLIECFFGNFRVHSYFKENYKFAMSVVTKSILATQLKTRRNFKTVNTTRLNQAGAKLGCIDNCVLI